MAETQYTYSISEDFIDGIDPSKLRLEIINSSIEKTLNKINTKGGITVYIYFNDELTSGEETVLDGLVSLHEVTTSAETPPSPVGYDNWVDPDTGIYYYYDPNREMWLSHDKKCFIFSRMQNSKGVYLTLSNYLDSMFGYRLPLPSAITGISLTLKNSYTKSFELRDGNDNDSLIYEIEVDNANYYMNQSIGVSMDANTFLKFWVSQSGSTVKGVLAQIQVQWRKV